MKSNIFKFLFIVLLIGFGQTFVFADVFNFETKELQILERGNILKTNKGGKVITDEKVEIYANEFEYNKAKLTLTAIGDVKLIDEVNQLIINAEKIIYLKKEDKILINSKVKALVQNLYEIESENIVYNRKEMKISSMMITKFSDKEGNKFSTKNFKFDILKKKIRAKNIEFIDIQKDQYNFDDAIIDLTSNEIVGKDVSVKFNNSKFGNQENQPRLKGNVVYTNNQSTILKKGVFTTCKKRDKCPPWIISAEEVQHDKVKKIINYKNAWLKVYDVPVIYFPKFFHPDPTVKRQSGFLTPSLSNSNTFGLSTNIPYYHVISDNKDLTFTPRIYSDKDLILQSEYREVNKNSNHIFDTSYKKNDSKIHFFSNSLINLGLSAFDTSELEINLQKTSNDTYLKAYQLKSPLIKNDSTLNSFVGFEAYRDDLSLNSSIQVFEKLNEEKNDRYEFILPSFEVIKNIDTTNKLGGNLSFKTTGHQKQYNTNLYEASVVNDLIFNSDPIFNKNGFKNNYNVLLRNPNSATESSTDNNENHNKFLTSFLFETSYPLRNEKENNNNYLTPILQLRYSPNKSKNAINDDRRIDINNIYSFDRIGSGDSVEGGQSITLGSGYKRTDKDDNSIIDLNLAAVFRDEINEDLPVKSTIGNTSSDIIGNFEFKPNNIFDFKYDFSINNDLERSNYDSFKTKISVNNFVTSFEYLEENNVIGDESFLANQTSIKFSDKNFVNFSTRKNKKTNLTEFYNLMYEYKNDCLTAAIEYNKQYYEDSDLKPSENIFLSLTIIPLGQTTSPNIR